MLLFWSPWSILYFKHNQSDLKAWKNINAQRGVECTCSSWVDSWWFDAVTRCFHSLLCPVKNPRREGSFFQHHCWKQSEEFPRLNDFDRSANLMSAHLCGRGEHFALTPVSKQIACTVLPPINLRTKTSDTALINLRLFSHIRVNSWVTCRIRLYGIDALQKRKLPCIFTKALHLARMNLIYCGTEGPVRSLVQETFKVIVHSNLEFGCNQILVMTK